MNLDVLATELSTGHPVTGAYSEDSSIAATEINAKNRSRTKEYRVTDVTILGLFGIDRGHTILTALEAAGEADAKTARIVSMLQDRTVGLDVGHADAGTFLAGLVTASIITSEESTTLQSLATDTISRAEELGLGVVKSGHIQEARRA